MSFFGNKPPVFDWAKEEPLFHYEISLTYNQRADLIRLIAHEHPKVSIAKRNYLVQLLRNAKRHDGPPLPDATLDWRDLEQEARRQGCGVADILFDRAKGKDPR